MTAVPCRLCTAPRGQPCRKGLWPYGRKTRAHAERRRDAETASAAAYRTAEVADGQAHVGRVGR